jgi:hypothetical protein
MERLPPITARLTPDKFPKQPVGFSPLSKVPEGDPRGLVGYFQINPDDVFSTPYLPESCPTSWTHWSTKERGEGCYSRRWRKSPRPCASRRTRRRRRWRTRDNIELGEIGKIARGGNKDGLLGKDDLARDEAKALGQFSGQERLSQSGSGAGDSVGDEKGGVLQVRAKTEKLAAKKEAAEDAQAPDFENYEHVGDAPATPPPPPAVESAAPATPSLAVTAALPFPEPAKPAAASVPAAQRGRRDDGFDRLEKTAEKAPARETAAPPEAAPGLSDPFQARLVDQTYLSSTARSGWTSASTSRASRWIWRTFYSWLMDRSFANVRASGVRARAVELSRQPLAQYGIIDLSINGVPPLFERALGYRSIFSIGGLRLAPPADWERWFLNALSIAVGLLATIGLFLIYRSAAAQVTSRRSARTSSRRHHELKTPLTSIRMYSEMLEETGRRKSRSGRVYRQISKESGRLSPHDRECPSTRAFGKENLQVKLEESHSNGDFDEICEELKKDRRPPGLRPCRKEDSDLPPSPTIRGGQQILMTLWITALNSARIVRQDPRSGAEAGRRPPRLGWRDRGPGIPPPTSRKFSKISTRGERDDPQDAGDRHRTRHEPDAGPNPWVPPSRRATVPTADWEVLLTFPAV